MFTKFQIALQYYPDCSEQTASRYLRRDIHEDPALLAALRKVGYRNTRKKFSERQVQILREYLGEPL